jgi:hypothetical protein
MKKTELKKILKPLIKECVREAIFEDGILSGIISEVTRGFGGTPLAAAPSPPIAADPVSDRIQRNAFDKEQATGLREHKKKLMAAIGTDAYNGVNLFEGTTPAPAQGNPRQMADALHGHEPRDAGVDISNLFGSVGSHWNAHMGVPKEGK